MLLFICAWTVSNAGKLTHCSVASIPKLSQRKHVRHTHNVKFAKWFITRTLKMNVCIYLFNEWNIIPTCHYCKIQAILHYCFSTINLQQLTCKSIITVHLNSCQLHLRHSGHMWLRTAVLEKRGLEEAFFRVLRSWWEREPCPQWQKAWTEDIEWMWHGVRQGTCLSG